MPTLEEMMADPGIPDDIFTELQQQLTDREKRYNEKEYKRQNSVEYEVSEGKSTMDSRRIYIETLMDHFGFAAEDFIRDYDQLKQRVLDLERIIASDDGASK